MDRLQPLRRLAAVPPERWLLMFDFDGTLAAIESRPEDARLDPRLLPSIAGLRRLGCRVVVVSARELALLEQRLPAGWDAVGSYGWELPATLAPMDGGAAGAAGAPSLEAAAAEIHGRILNWPGYRLEVKRHGLAVHYRGAGEGVPPAEVGATLAALAHRHGLELVPGRMVFELRPVGPDKGTAVRALVGALKPEAVLYCGDDRGDVPAWRAVQELDSRIVGLAVGIASEELDRDSLAECDVILEDREELLSACALLLEIASARAAG